MNRAERLVVNSPGRRLPQRYEVHQLIALGGRTPGAHVAEIGCGSGFGTKLILDRFGAAHVDALDLDPDMIARARRRLARYGDRVRRAHGNATDLASTLDAAPATYDAIFDFAIIHHVSDWRDTLAEVAPRCAQRPLLLRRSHRHRSLPDLRTVPCSITPSTTGSPPEFLAELPRHGLDPADRWATRVGSDYLLGVATRVV